MQEKKEDDDDDDDMPSSKSFTESLLEPHLPPLPLRILKAHWLLGHSFPDSWEEIRVEE